MKPEIRMMVWDRDNGKCQFVFPNGRKCGAPAGEVHHVQPRKMGGRHGKAKADSENPNNYECRCWLHNHAVLIDGRYYMGHTE